jgi:5-methylcytosine-specific restriction protein B
MLTPATYTNAFNPTALQVSVDAIQAIVSASPAEPLIVKNSAPGASPAPLFATTSPAAAEPEPELEAEEVDEDVPDDYTIIPKPDLLGIDPSVYQLIEQSLTVKQHLMFYGPPGTGKTTLAEYVASIVGESKYKLVTGTADWTSQDIVGGYQPTGEGKIAFVPGLILENFDRPVIIDELNRVDIDKAIGPLFTVLSGQGTTLAYLDNPAAEPAERHRISILPEKLGRLETYQYAPTKRWRLFATINTVDKASLYQMSYALSRRFAWILVDVPTDKLGFILEFLVQEGILPAVVTSAPRPTNVPLMVIWEAVNEVRSIGAAPIIDIIRLIDNAESTFDFFVTPSPEGRNLYLNGFYAFLLPLLDGILKPDGVTLAKKICAALGMADNSPEAKAIENRVTYHAI